MELKAFKTLTLNYKGEMVSVKYEMKYLNGDKWEWIPEDETIIHLPRPKTWIGRLFA